MNQVLAGTTALILAFLLWGLGKKPRNFLISKNNQNLIKITNDSQISLVKSANDLDSPKTQVISKLKIDWKPPQSIQETILLRKKLRQLITGGPEERLEAIVLSDLWGHQSVIPTLKRGLRDTDSYVVERAANALFKYKGCSNQLSQESRRPPRNVALLR